MAALVAAVGGVVWWYAPRAGYWILLVDGLLTMSVSGVALVRGAVPSGCSLRSGAGPLLLLAAILHLTGGAGRSGTVTLVAVISLLVLSALGLGQYVRTTWSDDERAILERLPQLVGTPVSTWTVPISPAPDGAWTLRVGHVRASRRDDSQSPSRARPRRLARRVRLGELALCREAGRGARRQRQPAIRRIGESVSSDLRCNGGHGRRTRVGVD